MFSLTEAQILQKSDEWQHREGELSSFVEACFELLRIQARAKTQFALSKASFVDAITSQTIIDRLASGAPLLTFEDLILDWEQVKAVFQEIAEVVAKDSQELTEQSKNLEYIASNGDLLQNMVRVWYQGTSLANIAKERGIHNEMLSFVVQATLKPFISLHSEVLLPKVDQELWRRRYCPVCGGRPDLAYLEKEVGTRWLLCSRCDAEWLFQRLECPYCGSQNQDSLAYFTDDKELYRLYVCEQCKRYLKAIDLRQAQSEVLLPLERFLTVEIDAQAHENGYNSCAEVTD